jgi:hypothetical protein
VRRRQHRLVPQNLEIGLGRQLQPRELHRPLNVFALHIDRLPQTISSSPACCTGSTARRDPAAGCNSWAGYAGEDAAQALDELLNIQLGRNTRGDPVTRWTTADDGMHVLALLLYDVLQRGGFDPASGRYADFLAGALTDQNLWPRDLEARYLELTGS